MARAKKRPPAKRAKKSARKKSAGLRSPSGAAKALRDYALSLPGAYEEFPWGERVVKVAGKVFVFLGHGDVVGMSAKLPASGAAALTLPFCEPTGYGLGKAGWVSVRFAKGEKAPIDLLLQWIDESYRAVAPKKLARPRTEK